MAVVVYERTGSPAWAATVTAVSLAGFIGLGQALATLADRYGRITVMIVADLVRAACFAAMLLSVPVGVLLLLAFLAGLASPPFEAARSAALPDLVPEDRYGPAVALSGICVQASLVLGYALGGALLQVVEPKVARRCERGIVPRVRAASSGPCGRRPPQLRPPNLPPSVRRCTRASATSSTIGCCAAPSSCSASPRSLASCPRRSSFPMATSSASVARRSDFSLLRYPSARSSAWCASRRGAREDGCCGLPASAPSSQPRSLLHCCGWRSTGRWRWSATPSPAASLRWALPTNVLLGTRLSRGQPGVSHGDRPRRGDGLAGAGCRAAGGVVAAYVAGVGEVAGGCTGPGRHLVRVGDPVAAPGGRGSVRP